MKTQDTDDGKIVSFPTPRLDALEKLYVRAYISTLSHAKAYEVVNPGLKNYFNNNPYSSRENVKFHITSILQEKAEALALTPDVIIEKLYKEATREGNNSNHSARIQALTQLGKHFGMFQEKKEVEAFVFNIVDYKNITPEVSETPSALIEAKEEEKLEGITFTSYDSLISTPDQEGINEDINI